MRLVELEPQFLRYEERLGSWREHKKDGYADDPDHKHIDECWETVTGQRVFWPFVMANDMKQAQGLKFLCPKCFERNNGPVGTHSVIIWSRSRGVPDHATPTGRWTLDGVSCANLTVNGDPPGSARSIQLIGGCAWHGYITNGRSSMPDLTSGMVDHPWVGGGLVLLGALILAGGLNSWLSRNDYDNDNADQDEDDIA